jgi:hypothetical protein
MAGPDSLHKITRLITTHNVEGQAVFSDAVRDHAELTSVDNGSALFGLQYCTDVFPSDLNQEKDIDVYKKYCAKPPGLVISNGTVVRTVVSTGLTGPGAYG